jgi:hypothetical protein
VDDFSHRDEMEPGAIRANYPLLARGVRRAVDVLAPTALAPFDVPMTRA